MSTIKTTNITHGSNSGTENLVLASNGNVTVGADLIATKQNGCQRIVLEQFFSPCDGSVIATSAGNVTLPNVTAQQTLSTSYADITGSSITYTPPSGATQVIYELHLYKAAADDHAIHHQKLFLDSDEVTKARMTHRSTILYDGIFLVTKWGFNIGGTADTSVGRVASWSSGKTIKATAREYASSNETAFHETGSWDASAAAHLVLPSIGITAIG